MKRNQVITKEELLEIATPLNGTSIYASEGYAELIVWMTKEDKPSYFLTGKKKHELNLVIIDISDDSIKLFQKKRQIRTRTTTSATAQSLNKLLRSL